VAPSISEVILQATKNFQPILIYNTTSWVSAWANHYKYTILIDKITYIQSIKISQCTTS